MLRRVRGLALLVLMVTLAGSGCGSAVSEADLKQLQSEVQALNTTLKWTQQELLAAEDTMSSVQEQNLRLQSQLEQTLSEYTRSAGEASTQTCVSDIRAAPSCYEPYLSSCSYPSPCLPIASSPWPYYSCSTYPYSYQPCLCVCPSPCPRHPRYSRECPPPRSERPPRSSDTYPSRHPAPASNGLTTAVMFTEPAPVSSPPPTPASPSAITRPQPAPARTPELIENPEQPDRKTATTARRVSSRTDLDDEVKKATSKTPTSKRLAADYTKELKKGVKR